MLTPSVCHRARNKIAINIIAIIHIRDRKILDILYLRRNFVLTVDSSKSIYKLKTQSVSLEIKNKCGYNMRCTDMVACNGVDTALCTLAACTRGIYHSNVTYLCRRHREGGNCLYGSSWCVSGRKGREQGLLVTDTISRRVEARRYLDLRTYSDHC